MNNQQIIDGYSVASGRSISFLQVEVERAMRNGWQPLGGVAVNNYGELYQAMVTYRKGEEDVFDWKR